MKQAVTSRAEAGNRGRSGTWAALLGALFCGAAFAASLPACWGLRGGWLPVVAYCLLVFGLVSASVQVPARPRGYLWLLGAAALAVRLAWIAAAAHAPLAADDYLAYRQCSLEVVHHGLGEAGRWIWPWGYILFLAELARLFGPTLWAPWLANALLGTGTVLLVYAIARRLLPERTARCAAGVYAFWPGVIAWHSLLCTDIPHLTLFLAALFCLLRGGGIDPENRDARWLCGGGVLAALAEFVRPVSPLLLLPFLVYAFLRRGVEVSPGARVRRWGRVALPVGAAYLVVLGGLLAFKSAASGYPTLSASYTYGLNLPYGLNWETGGMWSQEDEDAVLDNAGPRATVRRGLALAGKRLAEMSGRNAWKLPVLAARKFPEAWSLERTQIDANQAGIPEAERPGHWLFVYELPLFALVQLFHSALLALAAVGFWRARRAPGMALLAGVLLAFGLAHTVLEVQDRYHFWAQAFFSVAAAAAFLPAKAFAGNRMPTLQSSTEAHEAT